MCFFVMQMGVFCDADYDVYGKFMHSILGKRYDLMSFIVDTRYTNKELLYYQNITKSLEVFKSL